MRPNIRSTKARFLRLCVPKHWIIRNRYRWLPLRRSRLVVLYSPTLNNTELIKSMETTTSSINQESNVKHSTKAGFICIGIAALALIFLGPLGWFFATPLALVTFILAIVAMSKGNTKGGLILLGASIGVPLLVQLIWIALLGGAILAS